MEDGNGHRNPSGEQVTLTARRVATRRNKPAAVSKHHRIGLPGQAAVDRGIHQDRELVARFDYIHRPAATRVDIRVATFNRPFLRRALLVVHEQENKHMRVGPVEGPNRAHESALVRRVESGRRVVCP